MAKMTPKGTKIIGKAVPPPDLGKPIPGASRNKLDRHPEDGGFKTTAGDEYERDSGSTDMELSMASEGLYRRAVDNNGAANGDPGLKQR